MKKFTKALSVVLAVMMIMCTISAFSFSASAAETTTTIYFAAPTGTSTANTWSSVSLYYGSTTNMSDMTNVALTKTGKVYSGSKGSLTTITSGDWEVFSVTLTSAQVTAINNSKYVGFVNQNSRKTALKDSIRKATTSGTYATTDASIATFNGKMFVINGSNDTSETGSYTVKVVNSTGNTPSTATIYFAAPNGTSTANTWSSVSLYYGSTSNMSDMTNVALSKTGNIYEGSKGSLTTIESGNWAVFSVTLNSAQIEAIDGSKYVGFVNQNSRKTALKDSIRKATASGTYATTDSSIASFNGKMFVINGSNDTTETGSYTVKVVDSTGKKPSDTATIYFAAPRGTSISNTWKSVQLYYGSTSTVGALKRIEMQRTGKVYACDKGNLTTLVSDDWDIYSLTLTATQIQAIDKESYVGFINVYNRKTGLKNSIVKATESGTYASAKSSIAAYDGKMFVINGSYDSSSEFTTYTVKVVSNFKGVDPAKPATTIYFAAPLGTGTANTWSSVSFYYGNESNMSNNTRIAMTKTGDTYAGDKGKLTTLVSGNWDIYSVTLNSEQINRADYAKYVGFVNGYSRKTGYQYPLQKATESGTYADVPKSIADYDGKMFIINGSYQGSEISYYTVKAVDYKASPKYTVKATSNVGTAASCEYSASNKQVTVTYTLKSSMLLENIQAVVKYDSKVLKLASTNSKKTISPTFYGTSGAGFEGNLNLSDMIKFNATNPDGYDFTNGQTVFTAVFDIVGSGDTTVDLDVYVLTATQNDKDVKLVYRDEVLNNNFTLTSKATV